MFAHLILFCVLLLSRVSVVVVSSSSSAFESDGEFESSVDGVDEIVLQSSIYQEFDSDFYSDELVGDMQESMEELVFQPDTLVFLDCPVAIAETASFLVVNHFNFDVHVYSVVSENVLFHPVMFQPQIVAPNESISVQILFLPYYQESLVSQLTVKTSVGDFEYQVKGFPVRNPYGLHPFVGIRIPSNSNIEQPIVIHNPHENTLHIKEVYTTESFLTLKGTPLRNSIGSDDDSSSFAPEVMWVIQPNTEKEIITLSIPSTLGPGFYQGYVHIKTDHDNMVLPVEVDILEGAVYAVHPTLEFGTLTSVSERKSLDIRLHNTGYETIAVTEVIAVDADPQLQINVVEPILAPRGDGDVHVATLVYTASSPGKINNKLLIVTNNSNAALAVIEVMYTVTVLHGGVGFEHQKAIFVARIRNTSLPHNSESTNSLVQREFVFTNYFNAHVSLQNVVVASCTDIFTTSGISEMVVVDSFGKWPSVVVEFNEHAVEESSHLITDFLPKTCWLEVFTNISSHRIPIYIIDGSLDLVFMDAVSFVFSHVSANVVVGHDVVC